jgi:hypothetical protein
VVANPMWNQPIDTDVYEKDGYDRFLPNGGITVGKADWAWIQHAIASLKSDGRAAVVLDAAAVTRGSGSPNDRERAIRKWFVDHDLIDGVIQLPDNIFYNTSAAGLILILRKKKPALRAGKIRLLDASNEFIHESPKNRITAEMVQRIASAYSASEDIPGFSKTITQEAAVAADYHLGPPRHVHDHKVIAEHNTTELLDKLTSVRTIAQRAENEVLDRMKALLDKRQQLLGSGEWPRRQLSELVRIETGRTPSRANSIYWDVRGESGTPWVTISDMAPHALIRSTAEKVTDRAMAEVFHGRVVKRGTLLMSFKLTIGRTATLDIDACHNEAIVAIYPGPEVDQKYLEYYLSQVNYRRYQDRAVKGNTLNLEKIARIEIILPPLPVQREIATALAELHRVIELSEDKAALLHDLFAAVRHDLVHAEHAGSEQLQ